MPSKQVTAQDIFDIFPTDDCDTIEDDERRLKRVDALLSQARQEVRREALKEMDEAVEAYQQAKAYGIGDVQSYLKLRQEYSGK